MRSSFAGYNFNIRYMEVNISVETNRIKLYIFAIKGKSNRVLLRIYKSDNSQQLESFEENTHSVDQPSRYLQKK